jgi:hypothetical protein
MEDTMVWGGLYQEGVASKEDCETFCLDNICEVANYVASNQLCFTATDAKSNYVLGFEKLSCLAELLKPILDHHNFFTFQLSEESTQVPV